MYMQINLFTLNLLMYVWYYFSDSHNKYCRLKFTLIIKQRYIDALYIFLKSMIIFDKTF